MGNVLTQFIEHLVLSKGEYALIDMEAGIEHFGRGIDNGVDLILMVVEPSYESLTLTGKVSELGTSIGKPVYLVFNKVDEENREWMKEILCEISAEKSIASAGLQGTELSNGYPAIIRLADFLEKCDRGKEAPAHAG